MREKCFPKIIERKMIENYKFRKRKFLFKNSRSNES